MWLEAIWNNGCQWDEHLDRERMEQAFLVLFRICDRWPPPKLYLDNPVPRAAAPTATSPVSPEVREQNLARIRELMKDLKKSLSMKEPRHGNEEKAKAAQWVCQSKELTIEAIRAWATRSVS